MRFSSPATLAQLEEMAPAIFSTSAKQTTSDQYRQVPTIKVLEGLLKAGYGVSYAHQKNARTDEAMNYSRHVVKLRPVELFGKEDPKVGDYIPEVVLVNSHDATTSYQVFAGLYRLVCSNGMMVGDSMMQAHRVTHRGDAVAEVLTATQDTWENLIEVHKWVEKAKGVEWSKKQQMDYARRAAQIRYGAEWEGRVEPADFLAVRRAEDEGNDAWRVFNRVQENLLQGGQKVTSATGRVSTSRAIERVTKNVKYNRDLWDLTAGLLEAA